jgi:membrane protein implicated in regulation of membrane protease activity
VLLVLAILLLVFVLSPAIGIAVVVLAAVLELGEFVFWRWFLRRYRLRTGVETYIGELVTVEQACDPEGRVRFRGTLWNARATAPLKIGDTARITGVDGLTLEIAPEDS